MKKSIYVWLGAVCFCVVALVIQWRYFEKRERDILAANVKEEIEETSTVEVVEETPVERKRAEDIFTDNEIVDLGYGIIAYSVPNDDDISYNSLRIFYGDKFNGDNYIALQYINREKIKEYEILYLPNVYGIIQEMKIEKPQELYIKYSTTIYSETMVVRLPIHFSVWLENDTDDSLVYKKDAPKLILSTQDGIKAGEYIFPQTVWTERFLYGEETYELSFERVSPVYKICGSADSAILYYADYCLNLRVEDRGVLFEQVFISYPVEYEEVHWLIDFSGDGFMDVALAYIQGSNDYTILIYNPETGAYENKPVMSSISNYPLWNEELSCMICWANYNDYERVTKTMYSFCDGKWEKVKKLQPVYSDDEYDDNNEPLCFGYCELTYSEDGDVIDETMLGTFLSWNYEESDWSSDNENNIKIYPDSENWGLVSGNVGRISINKVVSEEPLQEQKRWQVYIQPDMPEVYAKVLRQYEQFMNEEVIDMNDNWVLRKFQSLNGEWECLHDEVCGSLGYWAEKGEDVHRYSLKDLTGDGFPELIIGYYSKNSDTTSPEVIYYYSPTKGIVKECMSSYFAMTIYEDRIIEYGSGGAYSTTTYYQFQKDTEDWVVIERLAQQGFSDDENIEYFKVLNIGDESVDKPISETEFLKIKSRYNKNPIEFEWTSLVIM